MAAGPDGAILVLDTAGGSMRRYSDRGQLIETLAIPQAERVGWRATRHLAVAPNGTVAINDTPGNRVVLLYDGGPDRLRSFGSAGVGPGLSGRPRTWRWTAG